MFNLLGFILRLKIIFESKQNKNSLIYYDIAIFDKTSIDIL